MYKQLYKQIKQKYQLAGTNVEIFEEVVKLIKTNTLGSNEKAIVLIKDNDLYSFEKQLHVRDCKSLVDLLWFAVYYSNNDILAHLIKIYKTRDDLDINKQYNRERNKTALMMLVLKEDIKGIELILSHPKNDLSITNKTGKTVLELAEINNINKIKFILEAYRMKSLERFSFS